MAATYERLFDAGLITIDTAFVVRVSTAVRETTTRVVQEQLLRFDRRRIQLPTRFVPDQTCLKWHNQYVFRG